MSQVQILTEFKKNLIIFFDELIALFPQQGESPDAHHHVMFDQPLVVVTSLQAVLSGWYAADEQERWSRSLPMSKM